MTPHGPTEHKDAAKNALEFSVLGSMNEFYMLALELFRAEVGCALTVAAPHQIFCGVVFHQVYRHLCSGVRPVAEVAFLKG